jgi:NitT/TauT family transport system substrate-binding protein
MKLNGTSHLIPRRTRRLGLRLSVILSVLGALSLVLLPGIGRAPASAAPSRLTSLKVQLGWLNNVEFAGIYVAEAKGYFKKYGLDVTTQPGGTTIDSRSVVASGGAQIGTVAEATDEAIANAKGADLRAFGAIYQQNPGCMMVRADSGIKTGADLRGKTIGLQNPARDQVIGMLNYSHVPVSSVKLVTVGFDPTPFALGKVDAYTAFAFNEPVAMKLKGIKVNCISFSKLGLPAYGDIFIAKKSTVTGQANTLAHFLKAVQKGWQYALAHPQATVNLILKDYAKDQDPKQQSLQMKVQIPMLTSAATHAHGLLWMSNSVWKTSLKFLYKQHMTKKNLSVSAVATNAILKRAATIH